jgi:hypothetical protein
MKRLHFNFLNNALAFAAVIFLMSTGVLLRCQLPPGSGGLVGRGTGPGAGQRTVSLLWGWSHHQWREIHDWIACALLAVLAEQDVRIAPPAPRASLRGSMSPGQIAEQTGLSVSYKVDQLGLASDVLPASREGPLLRAHGLHMADLRRVIDEASDAHVRAQAERPSGVER